MRLSPVQYNLFLTLHVEISGSIDNLNTRCYSLVLIGIVSAVICRGLYFLFMSLLFIGEETNTSYINQSEEFFGDIDPLCF